MPSEESGTNPLWRSAWAALSGTIPERSSVAALEVVCTMLTSSVAVVMAILAIAHVSEGRGWYAPAAAVAVVFTVIELVAARRWRDATKSLRAIERACGDRSSLVWSAGVWSSPTSPASAIARPVAALAVISGVAQLGAAVHLYHVGVLALVASGVLALCSAAAGVLGALFFVWIATQQRDAVAISIERFRGDGVLRCALYGAGLRDVAELRLTLCDVQQRSSVPVFVEDRVIDEGGAVRFTVRCAIPSSVNWAIEGERAMSLAVQLGARSLYFVLPNKLDELRPRALV
ncbi:MAG: hypothetical protein U0269_14410 [Polyangiales bacterium]